MPVFESNQQKMSYTRYGDGDTVFLWAHGWGQDHKALTQLATSFDHLGTQLVIDFPGFGESPVPTTDWTITDYANFLHDFLASYPAKHIIWIGHSFGCRVGIKLASLYPDQISKLILIAAPGLPRQRPVAERIYYFLRIRLFKILKHILWKQSWKDALRHKFSSRDFNNAGPMKNIFLNTIYETLDADAQRITCPTLLICGTEDTETPVDISLRYTKLIPSAKLIALDGFDHYTILTSANAQVAYNIRNFVQS